MAYLDQLRIDVRGRYLGQQIINTFMYCDDFPGATPGLDARLSPEITGAAMAGLRDAFTAIMRPSYEAIPCDGHVMSQLIMTRLRRLQTPPFQETYAINWVGSRAVAGLPSVCAAVISRRTAGGTRLLNGRIYLSGIVSDDVVEGSIDIASDTWTGMQAMGLAMQRPLAVEFLSLTPAVVQFRKSLGPFRVFPAAALRQLQPKTALALQRRRAPGHGRFG